MIWTPLATAPTILRAKGQRWDYSIIPRPYQSGQRYTLRCAGPNGTKTIGTSYQDMPSAKNAAEFHERRVAQVAG